MLPSFVIWRGKVYVMELGEDLGDPGAELVLLYARDETLQGVWDGVDLVIFDPFSTPEHRHQDFGRAVPTVIAPPPGYRLRAGDRSPAALAMYEHLAWFGAVSAV